MQLQNSDRTIPGLNEIKNLDFRGLSAINLLRCKIWTIYFHRGTVLKKIFAKKILAKMIVSPPTRHGQNGHESRLGHDFL